MSDQFSYEIDDQTKWVEYDEFFDTPIQLEIRFLDDDTHQKILNKAKTTSWVKHQSETVFENAKLRKLLIKDVLVDIKARVKDLQKLVIPKVKLSFEGDPEKVLDYNKDVEALLILYAHGDFCDFLTIQARELSEFINVEKEEEKQNLKHGSGTKEVQKNSITSK